VGLSTELEGRSASAEADVHQHDERTCRPEAARQFLREAHHRRFRGNVD
jgi:hypothetical protein